MARRASGGIILSSVTTKYQLGFAFHAGALISSLGAATFHGTCESAMNAAFSASTSPAKEAGNLALSRDKKPSCGGRMGGWGPLGGKFAMSFCTDSPLSGAKAVMYTRPATFGSLPAWVITAPQSEWPTRIGGLYCVAGIRLVYATSSCNDVVGFWTMLTL